MSPADCVEEFHLCASGALSDGGSGVRFPVRAFGGDATGFAIRYLGRVHAYLNRCAHVPVELDGFQGEFFDTDKRYLMCSIHGAIYAPDTGICAGGPCRGRRLRAIAVREAGGEVVWRADDSIRPPG